MRLHDRRPCSLRAHGYLLPAAAALAAVGCLGPAESAGLDRVSLEALSQVDHIVYATPDLDRGVERIAALLGVRPVPGGRHPGFGTRNALLSLGPGRYLEIIGPDPESPDPEGPRIFGIDDLAESRIVTWVAKGERLEELVASASSHGVELGRVLSGTREKPDGAVLSWRVTDPRTVVAGGLIPFFIDWSEGSPHPSTTSPQGCTLLGLRAEHPDPERIRGAARAAGIELEVVRAPVPALVASIRTPKGTVELR